MNSDYTIAVHCMVYLASLPERMANSEALADNVCTNPARIRKIMSALRQCGYVRTREGIGGGYQLDCEPEEVNLGDLYKIICFGSLKPRWCSGDPDRDCAVSANISDVMDSIYYDAEAQLAKYLSRWTVQDILVKVNQLQASKR